MGELTRTFTRCDGYWPSAPLSPQARRAWTHLLGSRDETAVLAALDDYAAEGHPRPPVAGQLASRVKAAATTGREPEIERVRRQKARAKVMLASGTMTRATFDYYDSTYWALVESGEWPVTISKTTKESQ